MYETSDAIILSGIFRDVSDFDPSDETHLLDGGRLGDAIFGKYSKSDGSLIWARQYGTPAGSDQGRGAIADPATGNIYVAGDFTHTVDFNPGRPGGELTSGGGTDGFLLKLDANGNYLNAWLMGGVSGDAFARPTAVRGSTVYVTGSFRGTSADFPTGGTLENPTYSSDNRGDFFIMAFDQSPTPVIPGDDGDDMFHVVRSGDELLVYHNTSPAGETDAADSPE